jgi:hypothetical protein
MTVESDFYTLLSGNAGVTARVGARIYPDVLPEECAYPAIVFARTRTDSEPYLGLSGQSFGADVDLSVGCWGNTRTEADAAADAVDAALPGSEFRRIGRDAAADPETGLLATVLTVTTFVTA